MPTLFVITGLPGSGKTTLANKIVTKHNAILISEDEWMENICNTYYDESFNVVMDGGYWSKEERLALRDLAMDSEAKFELFYTKTALEELKKRVAKRNESLANEFQMRVEDLEIAYSKYQEPSELDEKFTLCMN